VRFTRANLLVAAGRDAEAAKQLENPFLIGFPVALDVLRMMQRGRVAERLGRREVAAESYPWVADVWHHADPELQPVVDEARAGPGAVDRRAALSGRRASSGNPVTAAPLEKLRAARARPRMTAVRAVTPRSATSPRPATRSFR
jgi:hypothetical protein